MADSEKSRLGVAAIASPRREGWEAFFAEHDVNEVDDGEVVYGAR